MAEQRAGAFNLLGVILAVLDLFTSLVIVSSCTRNLLFVVGKVGLVGIDEIEGSLRSFQEVAVVIIFVIAVALRSRQCKVTTPESKGGAEGHADACT